MMHPQPPEEDLRGRDFLLALLFGLVNLALLGDVFPELPLWIVKQVQKNRWYRAAAWVAWLFCGLGGVLLIGMGVAWGMTRPSLEQPSGILSVLQLAGMVLCLVAFLVIGGLLILGYITQGDQETREFASTWGKPKARWLLGRHQKTATLRKKPSIWIVVLLVVWHFP